MNYIFVKFLASILVSKFAGLDLDYGFGKIITFPKLGKIPKLLDLGLGYDDCGLDYIIESYFNCHSTSSCSMHQFF